MLDLAQNQPCVIRDCSEYVFVSVKYFEFVRMEWTATRLCVDSQFSSAVGEVTRVQGFVSATRPSATSFSTVDC